jgi:hypothetical protein
MWTDNEETMRCMVCQNAFAVTAGVIPADVSLVCGECNENLEGAFVGDQPVFYDLYPKDLAVGFAEYNSHQDKQVVGFDPKDYTTIPWGMEICMCPRTETRWSE